jgi:hypothetical protein
VRAAAVRPNVVRSGVVERHAQVRRRPFELHAVAHEIANFRFQTIA